MMEQKTRGAGERSVTELQASLKRALQTNDSLQLQVQQKDKVNTELQAKAESLEQQLSDAKLQGSLKDKANAELQDEVKSLQQQLSEAKLQLAATAYNTDQKPKLQQLSQQEADASVSPASEVDDDASLQSITSVGVITPEASCRGVTCPPQVSRSSSEGSELRGLQPDRHTRVLFRGSGGEGAWPYAQGAQVPQRRANSLRLISLGCPLVTNTQGIHSMSRMAFYTIEQVTYDVCQPGCQPDMACMACSNHWVD